MGEQKANISSVLVVLVGLSLILIPLILMSGSVLYNKIFPPPVEPTYVMTKPLHLKPMRHHTYRFTLNSSYVRVGNEMRQLHYYWFAPPKIEPGKKYPLILLMHGGTGYSYSGQYLTQPTYLERYPAFIIVPMIESMTGANALWSWWTPTQNPQELATVVEEMKTLIPQYPIDDKRIYTYGCSLGGTGVYGASEYFNDFFTAGVAVSGGWDDVDVRPLAKMPLMILFGSRDTVAPVENARNIRDGLRALGAPLKYKEFDSNHNCPAKYFHTPDIFDWLFAQRKR